MWYEIKENYIILNIKALPNSSKNIIAEIIDNKLKVKVKAPAVENAANKELVKFFSKRFGVSKSSIEFLSGMNAKQKKVKLPINKKIEEFIKNKKDKSENTKSI